MDKIQVGTRLKLIHAAEVYAHPVGTIYTVKQLQGAGLICVTDQGLPAFIPTNCAFPVMPLANGFQINRIGAAGALAVYEILDSESPE